MTAISNNVRVSTPVSAPVESAAPAEPLEAVKTAEISDNFVPEAMDPMVQLADGAAAGEHFAGGVELGDPAAQQLAAGENDADQVVDDAAFFGQPDAMVAQPNAGPDADQVIGDAVVGGGPIADGDQTALLPENLPTPEVAGDGTASKADHAPHGGVILELQPQILPEGALIGDQVVPGGVILPVEPQILPGSALVGDRFAPGGIILPVEPQILPNSALVGDRFAPGGVILPVEPQILPDNALIPAENPAAPELPGAR